MLQLGGTHFAQHGGSRGVFELVKWMPPTSPSRATGSQLRFPHERVESDGPDAAAVPATSSKYGSSHSPLIHVPPLPP
ncbi:hypothetical protein [Streptomyces sp. WM6386]|uniref:hypothetical protein n=1 Tax=Streptomyces sp. WM6386 TaxID=1415558 RepID=UPI0006192C83|nr:hypothetical protein [Streptomyces sp. WM6386]KKD03925.1 hypothetical protein TN53_32495 [Streptomyces sp. WM6386]